MTLTRERPRVGGEPPLRARQVMPARRPTASWTYWLIAILVAAAIALTLWLVPGAGEPELGEPITVEEFALLEDQLVRDPQLGIPGISVHDLMTAEMELPR